MSDFVLRICDVCNEMFSDSPCEPGECKLLDLLLDQDMAIVVRCKDCRFLTDESIVNTSGKKLRRCKLHEWVEDGWFCADGRKDGAE